MKTEHFLKFGGPLCNFNSPRAHSETQQQRSNNYSNTNTNTNNNSNSNSNIYNTNKNNKNNLTSLVSASGSLLTSENLKRFTRATPSGNSDRESVCSASSIARSKRLRARNFSMKSSKGISKKSKTMDYTNYAYNEAVGRLKMMLADNTYAAPKGVSSYLRNYNEDSGDNFSDNMSVIDRPVLSDISKYLSPSQKARLGAYRPLKKSYTGYSASKENLTTPALYRTESTTATVPPPTLDYLTTTTRAQVPTESVHAPVEIFNFIEKQADYIEQLEKESKYCRNELTNLLGKVKDVINENEQLTEHARTELATLGNSGGGAEKLLATTSPSSDSDEHIYAAAKKSSGTPRKKDQIKSPRYASAPNIVYEARISELEAELMQANIDLKRMKAENEELKRKMSHADPLTVATLGSVNCDAHRKQIEHLQKDKMALEESLRHLQKLLDEAKSDHYSTSASKRYIHDLVQMERSQAELEVKHLRDELDRQHERVRELQHEMARRLADERANAERRYNTQVDQLGGDLSSQWEQVTKLQLELERQKRYETDTKRDLANRNSQIEELKQELRANRSTFLADMAQASAEKQSLEQEITALRLQLDRSVRDGKTEAAKLNAEINSLRQRLDRGDADLLHSKREVLRLNDEIANLEKELAYGELKNEIRPTKKDLDKRISEMQDKHAETVNELEEMIQNQKQLMDKLTGECKTLTHKLEDTTLKHKAEKEQLRETNEKLMTRLKQIWSKYKSLTGSQLSQRSMSSESDSDSLKNLAEEHFSSAAATTTTTATTRSAPNLAKPLSTTSRPHLAQPIPYVPHLTPTTTLSQAPTAMMHYSMAADQSQAPVTHSPQQLLRQLQQRHRLTTQQEPATTNMRLSAAQAEQAPTTTVAISPPVTIMDSTITMTKISKTTLAWERNNNNNSSSSHLPANFPQVTTSQSRSNLGKLTWPPPTSAITTPTTAPMEATMIQVSNTIQPHTIQAPMIHSNTSSSSNSSRSNRNHNNHMAVNNMQLATQPAHMITAPLTMDNLDTSMTPRQQLPQPTLPAPATSDHLQQPLRQQRQRHISRSHSRSYSHNSSHSHSHSHKCPPQQHYQQQHRHHQPYQATQAPAESPRSQSAVQQQRAAYNRARAAALWGHQVQLEHSPAENPLCHNSLPRQPPARSNPNESPMIDPFELEFSISSPSLMRSCDSDTCTEIGDFENDDENTFVDDGAAVDSDDEDDDNDKTFNISIEIADDDIDDVVTAEELHSLSAMSVSPAPTTIVTVRRASDLTAIDNDQNHANANERVTM